MTLLPLCVFSNVQPSIMSREVGGGRSRDSGMLLLLLLEAYEPLRSWLWL
jgi:hypothetical protein